MYNSKVKPPASCIQWYKTRPELPDSLLSYNIACSQYKVMVGVGPTLITDKHQDLALQVTCVGL